MWVAASADACPDKGQRGALSPKPLTCGVFDLVGLLGEITWKKPYEPVAHTTSLDLNRVCYYHHQS